MLFGGPPATALSLLDLVNQGRRAMDLQRLVSGAANKAAYNIALTSFFLHLHILATQERRWPFACRFCKKNVLNSVHGYT